MQTAQSNVPMQLVEFAPGSIIELDDPLTGLRRLGFVCDTGTEFLDFIDSDNPATPLAILDVLDPQLIGDDGDWTCALMESGDVPKWYAFRDLTLALFDTPAGSDKLTRCRAAYHAYKTDNYDLTEAIQAGLRATAEARTRQAKITERAAELIEAGVL